MESLQTARLRHLIATYPATGLRAHIEVRGGHVWLGLFEPYDGEQLPAQLWCGSCSRRTPANDVDSVLSAVHYLTRPAPPAGI